jgi:hypothetical protein
MTSGTAEMLCLAGGVCATVPVTHVCSFGVLARRSGKLLTPPVESELQSQRSGVEIGQIGQREENGCRKQSKQQNRRAGSRTVKTPRCSVRVASRHLPARLYAPAPGVTQRQPPQATTRQQTVSTSDTVVCCSLRTPARQAPAQCIYRHLRFLLLARAAAGACCAALTNLQQRRCPGNQQAAGCVC